MHVEIDHAREGRPGERGEATERERKRAQAAQGPRPSIETKRPLCDPDVQ